MIRRFTAANSPLDRCNFKLDAQNSKTSQLTNNMYKRQLASRRRTGKSGQWVVIGLVAAGLVATGVFFAVNARNPQKRTILPTSKPATLPATPPVVQKTKPADYMDVVRAAYPNFPTTQPLAIPLSMSEAAKIILTDPLYLDSIGELWITHDAESTASVLKSAGDRSSHVIHENVVFVQRWPDENGIWQPQLICRKNDGRFEIVTQSARQDIQSEHAFDWSRSVQLERFDHRAQRSRDFDHQARPFADGNLSRIYSCQPILTRKIFAGAGAAPIGEDCSRGCPGRMQKPAAVERHDF